MGKREKGSAREGDKETRTSTDDGSVGLSEGVDDSHGTATRG